MNHKRNGKLIRIQFVIKSPLCVNRTEFIQAKIKILLKIFEKISCFRTELKNNEKEFFNFLQFIHGWENILLSVTMNDLSNFCEHVENTIYGGKCDSNSTYHYSEELDAVFGCD